MIFQSKSNCIFGAYSPCRWQSNKKVYIADDTLASFIFSQTHDKLYHLKQDQKQYAIYPSINFGPTFGGGHDIEIKPDFSDGYSQLGHSINLINIRVKIRILICLDKQGQKQKNVKFINYTLFEFEIFVYDQKAIKRRVYKVFLQCKGNQEEYFVVQLFNQCNGPSIYPQQLQNNKLIIKIIEINRKLHQYIYHLLKNSFFFLNIQVILIQQFLLIKNILLQYPQQNVEFHFLSNLNDQINLSIYYFVVNKLRSINISFFKKESQNLFIHYQKQVCTSKINHNSSYLFFMDNQLFSQKF
ncbi:unnamed protein product [Paramecium sonneborni]|uniref:TLDc domain-containing protein n=1 Tax=Paramecium sonneborni TaxID=65129 RepID=A0A8S1RVI6_9CILI|nr:unnamed protein product [Paramecium sonneborni]